MKNTNHNPGVAGAKDIHSFISYLKSGKYEYSTRHQEDCWGIKYHRDGKFMLWSQNYQTGIYENTYLTEKELKERLSIHSPEILWKGLKDTS